MQVTQIFKACEYKEHWCDGKHIPIMKKTGGITIKGYPEYSNINTSKAVNKESCRYFINKKCIHPQKPKTHKQHT